MMFFFIYYRKLVKNKNINDFLIYEYLIYLLKFYNLLNLFLINNLKDVYVFLIFLISFFGMNNFCYEILND